MRKHYRHRKYCIYSVALALLGSVLAHRTLATEQSSLRESVQLVPLDEKDDFYTDVRLRRLTSEVRAVATQAHFNAWAEYEDEYISFSYPRHDLITLKVLNQPESDIFRTEQGLLASAENTLSRSYVLNISNRTYCAMTLDKADDFDNETCFCGRIVYQKFKEWEGSLCRFSFLRNGYVKTIQVQKGDRRLVFHEWTHVLAHQDAYFQIAESVRLKPAPDFVPTGEEERRNYLGEGWLEKGMNKTEVVGLLGQPTRVESNSLFYVEDHSFDPTGGTFSYRTSQRIDMVDGFFRGFSEGWLDHVSLPPLRGTPRWILEKAEHGENSWLGDDDYDLGPVLPEEMEYIFAQLKKLIPNADPGAWSDLCSAVHSLCDEGYWDAGVMEEIEKRYLEVHLPSHHASWALHRFKPNASKWMFVQKLKQIYWRVSVEGDPDDYDALFNVYNLILFTGKSGSEIERMVTLGLNHNHPAIRDSTCVGIPFLKDSEALAFLRRGLQDIDPMVRQSCARYFQGEYGSLADLEFLTVCLERELDPEVRESLHWAVAYSSTFSPCGE